MALFVAVLAGSWDAWWHGAVGRDSLWIPPHLLLYATILGAILAGVLGWLKTKEKVWRRLAALLVLIPLSAPLDEISHRLFGIENLASPFIIWAPAHLILVISVIGSLILLLPIIRKSHSLNVQRFFGAIAFAVILTLAMFVVSPFNPVGPYHVINFWGAGATAGVFVGVLLVAQRWLPGQLGDSLLTIVFFITISAVGFTEQRAVHVIINPYPQQISWLVTFTYLATAIFLDLVRKPKLWICGALAGLIYGLIFYATATNFFESQFQYGNKNILIAIVSTALGGLVAGFIVSRLRHTHTKS